MGYFSLIRMSKHLKSVAHVESCGIGCSYDISTVAISEFTCGMKIQNPINFTNLKLTQVRIACKLLKLSRPDVLDLSRTYVARVSFNVSDDVLCCNYNRWNDLLTFKGGGCLDPCLSLVARNI
jgi:hypothetical protein